MLSRRIDKSALLTVTILVVAGSGFGQSEPETLNDILSGENLSPAVSAFQVRQYILGPHRSAPRSPEQRRLDGGGHPDSPAHAPRCRLSWLAR